MNQPTIEDLLRHASCLRELAYSLLHDESSAEDLIQDTWVAVLQAPPRKPGNLAGWLRTVATRMFYKRMRRERMRRVEDVDTDETQSTESGWEERARLWNELSRAVLELNEPYRSVVVMRFHEDLPPREIARRSGRPLNTVNSQIQRGLGLLRRRLEESGGRERWVPVLVHLAGGRRAFERLGGAASVVAGSWLAFAAAALLFSILAGTWFVLDRQVGAPIAIASGGTEEASESSAPRPEDASSAAREPATRRSAAALESRPEVAPDLQAAPELDLSMGGIVTSLRTLVVDADGQPVTGAAVVVGVLSGSTGLVSERPRRVAGVTDDAGVATISIESADVGSFKDIERCVLLAAGASGRVTSDGYFLSVPDEGGAELTLTLQAGVPAPIGGWVVDETGNPIEGAFVRVGLDLIDVRREGRSYRARLPSVTRTGPDGRFQVIGVERKRHHIEATATGFTRDAAWLDPDRSELTLRLSRGAGLRGTVRDERGAPVAGAIVFAEPDRDLIAVRSSTNADGRYEFDAVVPGHRFVWALDGARVAVVRLALAPGEELTWDPIVVYRPGLRLACVRESGEPLAGGAIRLGLAHDPQAWERRLELGADGRIDVPDCPDGPIDLQVFASAEAFRAGEAPRHVVRGLGRSAAEQTVVVAEPSAPTATLTGLILDADDRPFEESVFFLFGEGGAVMPHPAETATGRFAVRDLKPGVYPAAVFCGRLGAASLEDVAVDPGAELDLGAFRLPAAGAVALEWNWPPGHTLEAGQLLDGRLWNTLDDPDPSSTLHALLPGVHRLTVKRAGSIVERRHVEVVSGETVSFASGPRRRIEVRVSAPGGGARRATLRFVRDDVDPLGIEGPEPRQLELQRAANGGFAHVLALYTGSWRITLTADDGRSGDASIVLAPGPPPAPVSIVLE